MKTDIERLHKVIEGKITGRGVGKTFAKCHEVLGFLFLEHKNILCMVTKYNDLTYILPMLQDILKEHGLSIVKFNRNNHELFVQDSRIKFIVEEDREYKTRGYQGTIVYMRHWD